MAERLDVVEQVVSCDRCELHSRCIAPVAFSGPAPADIAVVGEAPGRQEDEQGAPFVGPAGDMLRQHLTEIGVNPERVAFINTVSCFPDGTPTWAHVNACASNKAAQLELVDPKWVLLAGKVALKAFRPELDISRARGRSFMHDGRPLFAVYHPSAALRNRLVERSMHEDMEAFKAMVDSGDWSTGWSDKCAQCSSDGWWFDDCGLAWCVGHMPDEGVERRRLLDRDYQETKSRAR